MKIGDVVNLTGQWKNEEEEFHYRSKIIDMDKNIVYIDYPVDVHTKRTIFIPLNESFYVRFIKDTAVYQFSSKAIERTTKVMPVLKITVPNREDFEKIQRRAYLRVETSVDIAIHCPEKTFSPFTTVTKDLSGGGARFIIPYTLKDLMLEKEQQLLMYLVLRFSHNQYKYLKTEASVVRVLDKRDPTEVSVSFQLDDILTEQQLIQFCFHVQREERRQRI